MDSEVVATPLIDPNLGSYAKFFDHKWCRRTYEAVRHSPLLEPIQDLMMAWRSANGAHVLPWLMVDTLRGYATGEVLGSLEGRACYSERFVHAIADKLEGRMQHRLKFDQRRELRKRIKELELETHAGLETARDELAFSGTEYWRELLDKAEFRFCILGVQRSAYSSLFFAYEDFLSNVIRTKVPEYSSRNRSIGKDLGDQFGAPLAAYCWDEEVLLARGVRHACAHNGGRFGEALEKYRHRFDDATGQKQALLQNDRFVLVGGLIQVMPGNTAHLFNQLKSRVSRVLDELAGRLANASAD